jgi:hypothetical protein
MTRRLLTITLVAALTAIPALVALGTNQAEANPDFGGLEFQWYLRSGPSSGPEQTKCVPSSYNSPGAYGQWYPGPSTPIPASWGNSWGYQDPWTATVRRYGYPPGYQRLPYTETPQQKWDKLQKRYQAFMINHPYDGSQAWGIKHQHFTEYLEQNWYNYWYRLRYGQNPPNHDSNYHGWGYGREGW